MQRLLIILLIIVTSLGVLYNLPYPTGLTVHSIDSLSKYEDIVKKWDFSNQEDYAYNSSEIIIAENQVKLNQIINNYSQYEVTYEEPVLLSAIYHGDDKTSDVLSKDENNLKIDKNSIFNIKFNKSVENNDIIAMYIKSGTASEIYLCNTGIECQSPGYGKTEYNGNESWYNITVSGLSNDTFNLATDKNIRIDLIKAVHENKKESILTNITYPLKAEIKTNEVSGIKKISSIAYSEELNNQSISYKYSADNGLTWNAFPSNLSEINIEEIRLSATLYSDGKSTPVLNGITMTYDKIQPKLYFEINQSELINISSSDQVTINSSGFLFNITTNQDVVNANISVKEFTNSSMEILKPLRNFVDIDIDENLKNKLNSTIATIYYTDIDIASKNIDESSLKIYYYNESNHTWMPLNSKMDLTNNTIEAVLLHFSIYGVFGSEINNATLQSPSNQAQSNQSQYNQEETKAVNVSGSTSSTKAVNEIEQISEAVELEAQITQETEEPLKAGEPFNNISATNNTKEKGITGFSTYVNKLGVENIIALIFGLSLLIVYIIYRFSERKKQSP